MSRHSSCGVPPLCSRMSSLQLQALTQIALAHAHWQLPIPPKYATQKPDLPPTNCLPQTPTAAQLDSSSRTNALIIAELYPSLYRGVYKLVLFFVPQTVKWSGVGRWSGETRGSPIIYISPIIKRITTIDQVVDCGEAFVGECEHLFSAPILVSFDSTSFPIRDPDNSPSTAIALIE